MNKVPPVKHAPSRSFERKQPIPGVKQVTAKVSARPARAKQTGSAASVLEAEVETWVNEGGAGDEPGNAPPPSVAPK